MHSIEWKSNRRNITDNETDTEEQISIDINVQMIIMIRFARTQRREE